MEERRIDLHAHTTCSDGSVSPTELVQMAARKNLAALAVTDHDTVDGLAEAARAGEEYGVEIVPGMEFNTVRDRHNVHLVGLYPDPENQTLQSVLAEVGAERKRRNDAMLDRLISLHLGITEEDAASLGDGVLTRGNLAQLLVDHGVSPSVKAAMADYLTEGKPAFVPKKSVRPEEAIEILHEAGALVFVAHFHQIDRRDLSYSAEVCRDLLRGGADGLETRYSEFDAQKQALAESMAEEFHCLRSGGSDFHGKLKPGLELGTGYEDLWVPYEYLEVIRAHRK